MGNCLCSKDPPVLNSLKVRKPDPWAHTEIITRAQLNTMREEFWARARRRCLRANTLGPATEIPDALRNAAEAEPHIAQRILESARIWIQSADMTVCYDERGVRYELPLYVLSDPTNLIEY